MAHDLPQSAEAFSRAQIEEVRSDPLPPLVAQALEDALHDLERRSMGDLFNQDWDPLKSEILTAVARSARSR